MNVQVKQKHLPRLLEIIKGEVPLDEVSNLDLKRIELLVMNAILEKKVQEPQMIAFLEHRTLQ